MDDDFNDVVEVGFTIVSEVGRIHVRQARCGSHHERMCANSILQLISSSLGLGRAMRGHHCEIVARGSERVGP